MFCFVCQVLDLNLTGIKHFSVKGFYGGLGLIMLVTKDRLGFSN